MSAAPPDAPVRGAPPMPCPRCGAELRGDQAWCLECGLAARTRLAPTPNWRLPLATLAAIGLAALAALIVAFVVITGNNAPVPDTATAPVAPASTAGTGAPAVPPATTTAPAATAPVTAPTAASTTTTATPPATTTPDRTGGAAAPGG